MIHLRPQRVYKPTTSSGNPNNSIANYLDRYYNQGLYRLRLETPRGTSLTEDNSQISCYAHFFNNTDGSEVTDRLKGRGFRPTWLLNDKPIDSTCISEDGYLLTLDSAHLTDYTQTVTLQALDTEILSALSDEPQFDIWLQQTLKGQGIQPTLLKQSETLINFALVNKKLKGVGRNLFRNKYFIGDLASRYEIPFDALQPREGDNTYTLSLDYKISPEDKASYARISCWYVKREIGGIVYDSDIKRDGEWHHKEYTIKLDIDPSKYPIYGWFTDYSSSNGRTIDMVAVRNIKLERGTVATDWTPAPEDVEESVSKVSTDLTLLERSLLDNDTGEINKLKKLLGNHGKHFEELAKALAGKASTGDVQKSARDAIAEAIKRAGEMDRQIKVGGRNLIVTSRWKAGYLYGDRDENAYPVGSENYKVLVGYDTFRFDPVYIPTLGEREVTYKLYDNGGSKNGTVQIHAYDKDKKFLWWSCDGWDGTIGHTNAWTLPTDTAYIRLGVTNDKVRAKVEFGTVATDWTPAPEDVEESVSEVSTSLTKLERSLLDPQQGEVNKLKTLLGKHSESFDELSNHPPTVDENGLWRIWNLRQQQYVTTKYKSRGDKGEDAGRYLGRAKRIHLDLIGNYMLETETGWRTAKRGDYVYLVGDLSNRGGDKDTYYIVRELKDNTVWEVYNIKGHTPRLTLDEQFHLLADGEMVSMLSLRGEAGHSPSPKEVLESESFQEMLGSKVTTPFYNDLSIANKYIDNAFSYIRNIIHTMDSSREYSITSSGYVSSRVATKCANIAKDIHPELSVACMPPKAEPQIRLVTYSDYESLKSQVVMLTSKLAQLEATNQITPITNSYVRAKRGSFGQVTDTLYPLYGDWILTSDSKEQYISFGGLSAEIGKSIYIQTRKRAYLYANGHAFYGLPGSSVRENQWLSNNTTYRFVRASSDSWLVTASSSPYPWT